MTHILRIWQSKLTSIYKLRFGKASQKCLQISSFNYYYRTTYKKVSTYLEREFRSYIVETASAAYKTRFQRQKLQTDLWLHQPWECDNKKALRKIKDFFEYVERCLKKLFCPLRFEVEPESFRERGKIFYESAVRIKRKKN